METNLIPTLIKNYKKRYLKKFVYNLKKLYQSKINYNYKIYIKNNDELISNKTHFRFKKNIKPINKPNKIHALIQLLEKKNKETKRNRNIVEKSKRNSIRNSLIQRLSITNNNLLCFRLVPLLINLINRLRIKKLKEVFEILRYNKASNKFSEMYKSFSINNLKLKKSAFIYQIKNIYYKKKLYKLFRKKFLHQISKIKLVKMGRKIKILKLFRSSEIYLKMNLYKKTDKLIRIWRIYTKLMIERRKKMKNLTKKSNNVHEKISEDLFEDKIGKETKQSQYLGFLDKLDRNEKNQLKKDLNISNKSIESYLSASFSNDMIKIGYEDTFVGLNSISNFHLKNYEKVNESPLKYDKLNRKREKKIKFNFNETNNVNRSNGNTNDKINNNGKIIKSNLLQRKKK